MGYEINSPVKQVWLPLDYNFIAEHAGEFFGDFSKSYQEKYGIDLHDVFFMNKNGNNEISVGSKIDLLGTYSVGDVASIYKTKIALSNGLKTITKSIQDEDPHDMLIVYVGVGTDTAHGFDLVLQSLSEGEVKSIDDLIVDLFEL